MNYVLMIFAGLGLFFIGVKETGRCFKEMSGRRMRGWMRGATG